MIRVIDEEGEDYLYPKDWFVKIELEVSRTQAPRGGVGADRCRGSRKKPIVLGVSGGIAAYKSAEIVRALVTRGAKVRVMMTRNATEFITPLTLQTLAQNPVATDTFDLTQESEIGHIRLADSADAIVIAPATADMIAKAATGIADDIVTTVLLATQAPVAFAPAMNVHMYAHPTVAENLAKLKARGITIIDPAEGELACGYEGKGRLPDPRVHRRGAGANAFAARPRERTNSGDGGTHAGGDRSGALRLESIIGKNGLRDRESGVASRRAVANSCGTVIDGDAIWRRANRRRKRARAARGNLAQLSVVTALVMAAAIADFRPAEISEHKVKKNPKGLMLKMASIEDEMPRIAAKKGNRILVGFAAETRDLETSARDKLKRKHLDLIVANDVTQEGAGFAVDTNIVTILRRAMGPAKIIRSSARTKSPI